MPLYNKNQSLHPEMTNAFKKTYLAVRNCYTNTYPDMPVSVGARLQGNNSKEVIITQDGHNWDKLAGNHQRQTFNFNIICFSKDYVTATEMADLALEYFSQLEQYTDYATQGEGGQLSNPEKQWTWVPRSQLMYYTDEDDFAVAVKIDCIITRK